MKTITVTPRTRYTKKGFRVYWDIYVSENGKSTRSYPTTDIYLPNKKIPKDVYNRAKRLEIHLQDTPNPESVSITEYIQKNFKYTPYPFIVKHLEIFKPQCLIGKFKESDGADFLKYLETAGLKVNTRGLYFACLKTVFNRAAREDLIAKNPLKYIRTPREEVKTYFFSEKHIQTLESLKLSPHSMEYHIARALLFSIDTGLRISDLCLLDQSNFNSGYLEIRQTKTRGLIKIKLTQRAKNIYDTGLFSLPTKNGKPNNGELSIGFERLRKIADIELPGMFHLARHTFAMRLQEKGVDLNTISKLLGHKSINMTLRYAKVKQEQKDEAISRLE